MTELNIRACPICNSKQGLIRESADLPGTTMVWYKCQECDSILLRAGDDQWVYQKVSRKDKAHLLKQCLTAADLQSLAETGAINPAPTSKPAEETDPRWGLRLNTSLGRGAKDYPQWARPVDRDKWHKSGVIVWDRTTKVITRLSGERAVYYLDHLQNEKDWEQNGITIGELAIVLHLDKPDQGSEHGLVDQISLDPLQAQQLFDLLLRNEAELKKMAEAEKKERVEAFSRVYSMIFRFGREHEIKELKWSERPMTWTKDETRDLWTCDSPPNRAIVTVAKDDWFWEVCIDRVSPGKSGYKRFVNLEDAVTWAEEQLTSAGEEDAEAEREALHASPPTAKRPPIDLAPYRIDPSALEPERITYEVVVEIDTAPEQFKTMELSCGRQLRYDERYLSPKQLAAQLQIDQTQYELDQPIGPNHSWNRGQSTVTYYRESAAIEQSQLMWNRSRIVEYYGKRKLLRARYGVREVQTGYVSWIGACENAENQWPKEELRAEYLVRKAEELTFANALDIDGFREYLGLSEERLSDDLLLSALHRRRADSPAIPADSRAESKRWLNEHRDLLR